MLRPAPIVDVLPLLDEERSELVKLLRSATAEDFERITACEPWTVRDLVAHLLGVDLSLLSRLRDGFTETGNEAPEGAALVEWIDERNASWVTATAWVSPDALVDVLVHTGALTKSFLAASDPLGEGEPVSWAAPGPAPWWLCAAREFSERWIHQQHIRDALGSPGLNGPSFVRPLLETLLRSLPIAYAATEAPEGTEVAVQIEGRGGGSWALVRRSGQWVLYEGRSKEAAATVAIDQDGAWRSLARNISAREARKRASLSGKKALAEPFFDAVGVLVVPD